MGADYAPVLQRLGSERIVTKFALRFLEDKTFSGLCDALDAHDAEEEFRMAHTLKGICLNLGFEPLRQASSELTEELRGRDLSVDYADAFQAVKTRYQQTVSAIRGIAG